MFLRFLLSFQTLDIAELFQNQTLHERVRELTLYPSSGMNRALNLYQEMLKTNLPVNAKALIANYRGKQVAWALVTFERDNVMFYPTNGEACIHIYVDKEYRRKGIGTQLVRLAKIIYPNEVIKSYDHDEPAFFEPLIKEGVCVPVSV